ncbi:hypothetical protein QBC37DRAFT_6464 [Rhypophila decipiens]|uniref:Uncharacterized protein n=1 Tax=Rhypophila decipiens TaxID=261697 RepID=A0AAN6YJC9_9PEZI|nr:hypothetical protein QBC37DRAFT_6464 [Rhypophila decipiens]
MAADQVYETVPARDIDDPDYVEKMTTTNPLDHALGQQTATCVDTTERDLERGSDAAAQQNENKNEAGKDSGSESTCATTDILLALVAIPACIAAFGVFLFLSVFLLRFGWSFVTAVVAAAWKLGAWFD